MERAGVILKALEATAPVPALPPKPGWVGHHNHVPTSRAPGR